MKLETRCCQTDDTSVGSFRAPLPKFKRSTTDDYRKSESCNCMKTSEKVKKRDDFSVYGEHVGNKLRSCGRSHFEISIAQHKIDDILFNLTMGVFEQNLHTNTECTPQFVYCQNYPHSTIHTSSSPAHNNEHYRSPSPSILSTSPSSNPPQSPQQNSHLFVIENIDSCSTPEFSGNHNNNP